MMYLARCNSSFGLHEIHRQKIELYLGILNSTKRADTLHCILLVRLFVRRKINFKTLS